MQPKQLPQIEDHKFAFAMRSNRNLRQRLTVLLVFCSFALLNCGGNGSGGGNNNGGNNGGGGQSATPALNASVTSSGNFSSGQQNATYSIAVTNSGNAATSGTVTVVDPPTGFTVTSIGGTGWTCTLSTTTCTRSDSLAAGQSFPPIVVTGNVTAANGTPVSIPLSVSGGGVSAPASSTPSVTVAAPALSVTAIHASNFNLGQQGTTYSVTVKNGASAGATSSKVTVSEALPSGETLVSMSGNGWTCPGAGGANTCDRSDTLANGASYPAITVTVNVAANASSPQVNQVSVLGGGMSQAASGSDSTTINMPDLSVAATHVGTFADGGNGTFNIVVSNVASGSTAGPTGGAITVTDTLPSQFTFVSAGAIGWNCSAAAQIVTCTNSGPLNPGAVATTIPVVIAVSASASGTIGNTASVVTFGDSNAGNNSSTDSVTFAPDLLIAETHSGNFGAGTNGVFTIGVTNVGTGPTTGPITLSDTLPSQFTFVSGNSSGWSCGALSQTVTCTNPGPLARGGSTASIPLIVGVNTAASGSVANTATVATAGDTNSANDSSTDNVTVLGSGNLPPSIALTVPGGGAGGVIYAGGNSVTVGITVTNEAAGDLLTPTLTLNGAACSTCGTLGSITAGTAGNYTMLYTPPASVTAPTTMTLTVSSNLPNAFPATANFPVYPAGARVVKLTGIPGGGGIKSLTARVFNDPGSPGAGLRLEMLGAGYACPPATGGGTICGTLAVVSTTSGTTNANAGTSGIPFTQVVFSYTAPLNVPNSPYDRPMILAVSNGDNTKSASINFALIPNGVVGGLIGTGSRLNVALTGTAPFTIGAGVGGDTGVNKTLTWTLTANGADCQPTCGTLGTTAYTRNGTGVNAFVNYTPPAKVPAAPADNPVLTVTSDDVINGLQQIDSLQFKIKDGSCGTGNNSALNGQYAFLVQGGSQNLGYEALVGSFTADGNGNITTGLLDINSTTGPNTGLTIVPAGSSYSIGPDNRGCLTLANSNGGAAHFRIALGTVDGSQHATQGRMVRFDDYTGAGQRLQGIVMKQDPTAFSNSAANGNYVFGYQGVVDGGARLAVVGMYHADGAGTLSSFNTDAIDSNGNADTNDLAGSGTYNFDPTTGRGTTSVTTSGAPVSSVFYIVNSSELLSMTTDAVTSGTPIVSGENRRQTTTSYTQTSLDNNAFVFYETAVDPANGSNVTAVAQVQFSTNGANTGEQDINDGGTLSNQPISGALTIGANGRMTDGNLVLYAIGTDSAVVLVKNNFVPFGYVQQQTGGPFTNASLSGKAFFGGGAPTAGGSFDSGSASFDGAGTLNVSIDQTNQNGPDSSAESFSYSVTSNGKFAITFQSNTLALGYVASGSRIVFMSAGTGSGSPELFIGQQ